MAQYLGTVKLGGFYNNGAALARPTKPWRNDSAPSGASSAGNIPSMSGSISNYSFGNTPSDDAKKLQWVKIKDGDKLEVSPEEGLIKNLTTGETIKVPPLSPVMQNLIDKGGLVNYAREQLEAEGK